MTMILALPQTDIVRLDPDRLAELFQEWGDQGAEDMICATMEQLSILLTDFRKEFQNASHQLLPETIRVIAERAGNIGLLSLSRVARDVEDCLSSKDGPALAATMARMYRIANRSLTTTWDDRDLTL